MFRKCKGKCCRDGRARVRSLSLIDGARGFLRGTIALPSIANPLRGLKNKRLVIYIVLYIYIT